MINANRFNVEVDSIYILYVVSNAHLSHCYNGTITCHISIIVKMYSLFCNHNITVL